MARGVSADMFKQPLIALDQFVNCFIYISGDGFGKADETLSARLFRLHLQDMLSDIPYRVVDAMFWIFEENHCFDSWRAEVERRHLPSFYSVTIVSQSAVTESNSE